MAGAGRDDGVDPAAASNTRSGSLVALEEYLYRRSGGMIGSLSHLVRGAAILAIEDGTEKITRALLDIVPVDHAAERTAAENRSRRAIG